MYRNIFLLFTLFFLASQHTFSQNRNRYQAEEENEYAVKKHNFMVSLGYATPSIVRGYLKHQTKREKVTVSGFGPLLLKTEFMLSDRVGICINGSYSNYKISWFDIGYDTLALAYRPFEFGIKSYELAGTLRGNYHFWKRKKVDSYAGIGIGYGLFHIGSYTYAHTTRFAVQYDFPPTLSLECTYGIKYFPEKNFGLFAEIGLGKSWILFNKYFIPEALIQGGITIKL